MEDQYGISDLRQYINGRSIFQPIVQPPDLLSGHGSLITPVLHHQYPDQMNLLGRQVTGMVPPPPAAGGGGGGFHPDHFRTDSATTTCGLPSGGGGGGGGCFSGLEMDAAAGGGFGAGDGGTGRWPRQETLTLLEIRSKLDSKFKEANHKGPLWDEVSRIMSEEHGYQRSGKKCREKFENLYKYYKKTKDGKAGRQDGKHYRFFRQLEALYGETSNNNASSSSFSANNHNLIITSAFPNYHHNNNNNNNNNAPVVLPSNNQEYSGLHLQPSRIAGADSLSLSNSSDFYYSTSSEDVTVENIDDSCEKRKKIFRKGKKLNWKAKIKDFIDSQMRKLMDKQEVWLEKMMRNIEEKEHERIKREEEWKKQEAERVEREQKFWANERAWIEARDASLMDCLRKVTGKEVIKPSSYNHHNYSDQHHIPSTMINEGILESVPTTSGTIAKKRKEDSRTCCYVTNDSSVCTTKNGNYSADQWDGSLRHGPSPHPLHEDSTGSAAIMPYGGYRYLLGDTGNLWLNNGVKFSKGENC